MRKFLSILAIATLLNAAAHGQVAVHKGGDVAQTEFDLRVLFIVTVAQADSANTVLANLATFPGEDTEVFSDAKSVRLSPTGAEPPTHYAAWGFFQAAKETPLRAAFTTANRKSWYNADVDTLAKVLAIIDAEGLQRIIPPPF